MVRIYGNVMLSPPQDVNLKQDEANVAGRKKIVFVDASSSTTVPAGSAETITIQPPAGKIWTTKYVGMYAPSPPGASSGTHQFVVYLTGAFYEYFRAKSNYSSDIVVRAMHIYTADNWKIPPDIASQTYILMNMKASHDVPLIIQYFNNTDADQTNKRIIRLLLEEEDEAP